jgi:hypothetical protein
LSTIIANFAPTFWALRTYLIFKLINTFTVKSQVPLSIIKILLLDLTVKLVVNSEHPSMGSAARTVP